MADRAEAYEQGRKAGLTEALEAVNALPRQYGVAPDLSDDLVWRPAVIETLTRRRDGS